MEQYLGICMIIVVTGLVIAVLAKLVTGNILDEFERIRSKRFKSRVAILASVFKQCADSTSELAKNVRSICELEQKMQKEMDERQMKQVAKEASIRTFDEFKKSIKDE